MRWWRRHLGSRAASRPWGEPERRTVLDREANEADFAALRGFVRDERGVEMWLEPETMATDTTVVAVAGSGRWMRRRVGSPAKAKRLADELRVPLYDVRLVPYPQRMRDWNARHR